MSAAMPVVETDVNGLGDGETFDVEPPLATPSQVRFQQLRGAVVHTIAHGGDATLTLLADLDGDGTFEISVDIGSLSGEGVSAGNLLEIGARNSKVVKLRITNDSGGPADYVVTGRAMVA